MTIYSVIHSVNIPMPGTKVGTVESMAHGTNVTPVLVKLTLTIFVEVGGFTVTRSTQGDDMYFKYEEEDGMLGRSSKEHQCIGLMRKGRSQLDQDGRGRLMCIFFLLWVTTKLICHISAFYILAFYYTNCIIGIAGKLF